MSNDTFTPHNSFIIKELLFTSGTGLTYDLKEFMSALTIFTSVFQSNLTARLILVEGSNLISNLPILGGETMSIKFKTSGRSDYVELDFIVESVPDRFNDNSFIMYKMNLVTPDYYNSSKYQRSRGYNSTYSGAISKILSDFGTERDTDIESSYGIVKWASPKWRPFQLIKYCASRAIDKYNMPMTFYEDLDGYHFASWRTMMQGDTQSTFYQSVMVQNETEALRILRNFEDLEIVCQRNIGEFRFTGATYESENVFDFLEKTVTKTTRDYETFFNTVGGMEEYPVTKNVDVSETCEYILKEEDLAHTKNYNSKVLSQLLKSHIIRGRCYGDSDLRLGTVHTFKIPSPEPHSASKLSTEKYISGKLLITAIRHDFTKTDYKTVIEFTKDSYSDDIEVALT